MEKGYTTLEEVAAMAEQYELAHAHGPSHARDKLPSGVRPNGNSGMPPNPNGIPLRSNGVPPKPQDQPNYSSNRPRFEDKKGLCFRCQKPGHLARDCKSKPGSMKAVAPATDATTPPKEYVNTMAAGVNGKAVTALLDTGCHYHSSPREVVIAAQVKP